MSFNVPLVLERPSITKETKLRVSRALEKRDTLLLVGHCYVDYKGRASSKLEPGDRIVILKEDGALLVHRPRGYEAVNWQPPGCIFQSKISNGTFVISAIRTKPSESVKIFFDSLYLIVIMKLIDEGTFSLFASENDMQKAILKKPSIIEKGLKPISYEKKVQPGFVDVYCIDKKGNLVIIEIKRNAAGRNAILQLSRYVKAVKGQVNRTVRGLIAAPKLAKGSHKLLTTLGLEFKPINPQLCAKILHKRKNIRLTDFFEISN